MLIGVICRQPGEFLKAIFEPRWRPASGWRRDVAWRTYAFLSRQCDLVLTPSQKIATQLNRYYPADNMKTVPNGVGLPPRLPSKQIARRELGLSEDEFIVINSGRHVREKRVEIIIKAFARTVAEAPSSRLVLLGAGPKDGVLKALAQELHIEDKVDFMGAIPRSEVFVYLAAGDIFVNACLREVASLAILEAASVGRPLILFDERLIEPLEPGSNGFFVKSVRGLSNKMSWFSKNPAEMKTFGDASVKRVRLKFSVQNHIKWLTEAYRQVL